MLALDRASAVGVVLWVVVVVKVVDSDVASVDPVDEVDVSEVEVVWVVLLVVSEVDEVCEVEGPTHTELNLIKKSNSKLVEVPLRRSGRVPSQSDRYYDFLV